MCTFISILYPYYDYDNVYIYIYCVCVLQQLQDYPATFLLNPSKAKSRRVLGAADVGMSPEVCPPGPRQRARKATTATTAAWPKFPATCSSAVFNTWENEKLRVDFSVKKINEEEEEEEERMVIFLGVSESQESMLPKQRS
jgi:hypothetical protein